MSEIPTAHVESGPTYRVVYSEALAPLTALVNKMMVEGWTPQGGIAMSGTVHLQALVRAPAVR